MQTLRLINVVFISFFFGFSNTFSPLAYAQVKADKNALKINSLLS